MKEVRDIFASCVCHTVFPRAMPNAESTSRVSPRVYKFFLSKQHKKMSNTCLIHMPIVI